MEHVRWHSDTALRTPTMVAAFTGWNDAADASSNAAKALVEGWGAELIASIDPEEYTDFATTRPHVRLSGGMSREIVWPQTAVWGTSTPGGDVLVVLGPEPSLRWRSFCDQIVSIGARYSTPMVLTLGALLADVPHTRPVQLMGSATDQALIDRFDLQRSRYEGPTGIVGVLHDAFNRAGVASASLWAATPSYAAQVPSPKAALALLRRATDMIGTPAPSGVLAAEVAEYDAQVDELVDSDDDLSGYVRRLERIADAGGDEDDEDDTPVTPTEQQGEQLISELEEFLRDQGDQP
jgi:proteasome assembly chaperone (PAC2) family protein